MVRLIEESLPAPYIMCSPYHTLVIHFTGPQLKGYHPDPHLATSYPFLSVPLFSRNLVLCSLRPSSLPSVSAAARRWAIVGMSIRLGFLMHRKQQTKTCLKAGQISHVDAHPSLSDSLCLLRSPVSQLVHVRQ